MTDLKTGLTQAQVVAHLSKGEVNVTTTSASRTTKRNYPAQYLDLVQFLEPTLILHGLVYRIA